MGVWKNDYLTGQNSEIIPGILDTIDTPPTYRGEQFIKEFVHGERKVGDTTTYKWPDSSRYTRDWRDNNYSNIVESSRSNEMNTTYNTILPGYSTKSDMAIGCLNINFRDN